MTHYLPKLVCDMRLRMLCVMLYVVNNCKLIALLIVEAWSSGALHLQSFAFFFTHPRSQQRRALIYAETDILKQMNDK